MADYLDDPRAPSAALVPTSCDRLLDVGCWRGSFGAALKDARPGIEVWGIEPTADVIKEATERLDRVITGLYPDDMPNDVTFDCVVFNDVLEHTVDPWDILQRTRPLLRPGGCIVASIPNVRYHGVVQQLVRFGQWTYRDTGILDRTHLRFFTKQSMGRMFADTGYAVEEIHPAIFPDSTSTVDKVLRRLGHRAEEFVALQYHIRAVPTG